MSSNANGVKTMSARTKTNQGKRHTGRLELRGKKWLALWMVGGKRYSQSTGLEDRAEAEKWLTRKLDDVRLADELKRNTKDKDELQERLRTYIDGKLVAVDQERAKIEAKADEHALEFKDAWTEYVSHPNRKRVTDATLENTRRTFEKFAAWMAKAHPGSAELRDVTVEIALEFAAVIRDELVPTTYNNTLAALQHVWSLLARKAKVRENPWVRQNVARQSAVGSSIRREISDAELVTIFREARDYRPPLERLFTVLLYTGARLSDASQLRWESIDLRRGFISFIPQKTRRYGEAARVKIPIMPPLRAMLEATPAEERKGYVMPDMAEAFLAGHLNDTVTRFFETRCGIETRKKTSVGKKAHSVCSAHSFRHKFVSLAANAGIPFAIVQRIVGHQTATMCAHYFHENEEATLQAFKAFPTLAAGAPQIEDNGEAIDIEATVVKPTRLDELKRLIGEIVDGGDAGEIEAAKAAFAEVVK